MTLGERIKELRKKNGLTQVGLAEKLDVTKGTVSTWETNSRTHFWGRAYCTYCTVTLVSV